MTNNIVVHFSTSLWKPSESQRASAKGFSVGDFKEYRAVSGSVFNEEYNETLDSATLVLSQVAKEDRLSNIKPYDYVRVFDKSSFNPLTRKYKFDKIYLIDNFNEKENNIKEHIFGYTINLMSETKILEKIQCPNLTITHDINNGELSKQTIYEHINRYMKLFVPKIKKYNPNTNKWEYRYLIDWHPQSTPFYDRFNVPCADMSFNCPTLRQLLTTLMQQVGCIPVVRNRVLEFLDFQKDAVPFAENGDYSLDDTVNYINRSLSSDSYVNTLVNLSDNVLDSGNEVICETLGFRDTSNVLLKQRENLNLETSLPIYKINKCILHAPGKCSGNVSSSCGCFEFIDGGYGTYEDRSSYYKIWWPMIIYNRTSINVQNHVAQIKFTCITSLNSEIVPDFSIEISALYFWKRNTNGSYSIIQKASIDNPLIAFNVNSTFASTLDYYDEKNNISHSSNTRELTLNFSFDSDEVCGFIFSGKIINLHPYQGDPSEKDFTFIRFDDDDNHVQFHNPYGDDNQGYNNWENNDYFSGNNSINKYIARCDLQTLIAFQTWDISKLVVENSVRQLLDRNFNNMISEISLDNVTIEKLSKYVYGTVGYSIGSNKISGFSEVFYVGNSTALGWVTKGYSYIENLVNAMEKINPSMSGFASYFEGLDYEDVFSNIYKYASVDDRDYCSYTIVDYSFYYYNAGNDSFNASIGDRPPRYFTSFFVDLYYQPLNSFNMSYVKTEEDVEITLAQYDGNASGLTDFDRLSIHEQEQVDRIGNETLIINQRTLDFNKIKTFENGPLIFRDDTNRSGEIDGEDNGVDYIIFKRSFTINNHCYNVSYVGSKDAVLKDYFTSIRTKYRAYQYVDYYQSVLRKEKDVLYIRIASDFYDGDDRVKGGTLYYLSNFVYDLENDVKQEGYKRNISYEVETDIAKIANGISGYTTQQQTVKNSISLISTNNTLGIVYEYMDNAGAGPYIKDITENLNLGGIPQSWQIWNSDYNQFHNVKFTNYIDYYSTTERVTSDDDEAKTIVKNQIEKIEKSPIVDGFLYTTQFSIVEDNKSENSDLSTKRLFYKDYAERINHTVQFIYYAPNKDVLVGEDFISGAPAINRYEHEFNAILTADLEDFKLNKEPYPYVESGNRRIIDRKEWHESGGIHEHYAFGYGIIYFYKNSAYGGIPYFEIIWPLIVGTNTPVDVLKLCHYDSETNTLIDIAVFRRVNTKPVLDRLHSYYYFMINDTKTDYVFDEKDGVLYKKYKVATADNNDDPMPDRDVIDLYVDNEEE